MWSRIRVREIFGGKFMDTMETMGFGGILCGFVWDRHSSMEGGVHCLQYMPKT